MSERDSYERFDSDNKRQQTIKERISKSCNAIVRNVCERAFKKSDKQQQQEKEWREEKKWLLKRYFEDDKQNW